MRQQILFFHYNDLSSLYLLRNSKSRLECAQPYPDKQEVNHVLAVNLGDFNGLSQTTLSLAGKYWFLLLFFWLPLCSATVASGTNSVQTNK